MSDSESAAEAAADPDWAAGAADVRDAEAAKGSRKRPIPVAGIVPEDSDTEDRSSSGDEETMKERAETLSEEIQISAREFQPHRNAIWGLQAALEKAKEELTTGRAIYKFEDDKRRKIIKPKSLELKAIRTKLERMEAQQELVKRDRAKQELVKRDQAG